MNWVATLIGALLGFGASMIPTILDMAKTWMQHKMGLQQKDAQIAAASAGVECTPVPPVTIFGPDDIPSHRWEVAMDVLRTSVRPVLTYAFFVLFFAIKITAMHHAYDVEHATIGQTLPLLWDEETSSLFAAVVSFWFGSRAASSVSTVSATESTTSVTTNKRVVNGDTGK